MRNALQVTNLRLIRQGKEILNIEEFCVETGETLAVVGPNGAGKSSLLAVLALLERPTSGRMELFGEAVENGNLLNLRRKMALVFQEPLLLDTTVLRNVTLPLRMRGIPKREAAARAEGWLERFGVSHLARRSILHLSGGEAQRTSLARAFALEPQILFLDEPFSALDYPTRKALLSELGPLLKEMRPTTIFVTHDYSEIPHLTENVAVLFEGKILRRGNVRDVFGREFLDRPMPVPWE